MSNKQELVSVKSLLRREDYQNRFKEILGARANQFAASVVNISRDQNIAACDPQSVIAAAIVAATLDLPVDKNLGFAWIVPYKQQASFQMGYKGFVQLALRSGQYARMNAKPVNKEAWGGYDEVGEPKILWEKVEDTKPAIGYAFAWRLVTGFSKTCYWSRERVEAHARQYSQSFRGNFQSPWKTHFDQMALKTVIKNELSDWGILSIDLQRALRHDQGAQTDIEADVVYVDNEPTAKPAEVSDLAPKMPVPQPATPAVTTPAAPQKHSEPTQLPTCKYCGAGVADIATHECEPMKAAIAQHKAEEQEHPTPKASATTPKNEAEQHLKALRELMEKADIGENDVLQFCQKNNIATADHTNLSQLSAVRIKNLVKQWANIEPEIKKLAGQSPTPA